MKPLLTLVIFAGVSLPLAAAELQKDHEKKLDALIVQLKDGDIKVRLKAAVEIGNMGTKARKKAIPALLEVLLNSGENFNVHNHAAVAMQKMGSDAGPALIQSLQNGTTFVRKVSARGLSQMGAIGVPALIKALGDPDRNVRLFAVQSLGKIGPPAKAATSHLKRAANDKYYLIATSATRALWLIQPRAKTKPPSFPHGTAIRGLAAFLSCSKTQFQVGEPISMNHGLLFDGNGSERSLRVWRPWPPVDPNNGSWFEITGPDGKRLNYQGPYISWAAPKPSDKNTSLLYRGEFVGRVAPDVSSAFNLTRPGTYIFRWFYAPLGAGPWSGKLISNPVKIKIVELGSRK